MAGEDQNSVQLTKRQKAALLLMTIDLETSAALMQSLTQEEVEHLVMEISSIKDIPSAAVEQVNAEFYEALTANNVLIQGSFEDAKKLVERSLGQSRAAEVLQKVKAITAGRGFDKLKSADSARLGKFLIEEHPQTIALILSNLQAEKAAEVLKEFPQELRNEVTIRMATLGTVSPALLAEMEKVVEVIAASEIGEDLRSLGGTKSVATLLNNCESEAAKGILEHIEQKNSTLAAEIKRLMFVFDDIIKIDDRGIQRILREVDKKDLAMSLKVAEEPLKEKIYANMSERARDLLKEELQYMGPVRIREVEAAQARIIDVVKQLEEQGEIVVSGRGGKEEVLV